MPPTTNRVSFIRLHDVESLIRARWNANQPFSLVRVGDGELSLLSYPDFCSKVRIQHVFKRAMRDRLYTENELHRVRTGMINAIRGADLVGLYDSFETNDLCVVHQEHIDYAGLEWVTACHPNVHIYMQSVGVLDRLIHSADRITLVTGRDVLEKFQATYPHANVDQYLVPVERQYELTDERARHEEHLPDAFARISQALRPEGPHHLHLIGAGLLAKEYCAIVKARGGFGPDIGSVFDYWANVPTREGKRAVKDGAATLAGESRWPAIWLGATPEPTALQATMFRRIFRPLEIIPKP